MKKDIEWLKSAIQKNLDFYNDEDEEWQMAKVRAYAKSLDLINQLDEPEVLLPEVNLDVFLDDLKEYVKEQQSLSSNVGMAHTPAGNDTHYRQYEFVLECIGEYEPSEELKELVPKQELPMIPRFVAEWIEEVKPDNSLRLAFAYIAQQKRDNYDDELAFWVEEGNSETFARAWLFGFTVEEEQRYRVVDRHEVHLLAKEEGHNKVETVAELVEIYGPEYVELDYNLTEQEIKDYDERYWPFAVKVEELEE